MAAFEARDLAAATGGGAPPFFDRLSKTAPRFTFALLLDPQIEGAQTKSPVAMTAQRRLSETVAELNSLPDRRDHRKTGPRRLNLRPNLAVRRRASRRDEPIIRNGFRPGPSVGESQTGVTVMP